MRIIAFLTDYTVVNRIINHLKLTFVADKPPPARILFQEVLMAAEASGEYFYDLFLPGMRDLVDFWLFLAYLRLLDQLCVFLLDLTSSQADIYNPGRWDKVKLVHKCLRSHRSPKGISYPLYPFYPKTHIHEKSREN